MFNSQLPLVELQQSLGQHRGKNIYAEVLAPWLSGNTDQAQWLVEFQERTKDDWSVANDEDLCRLYGFSCVTSTLIMRLESGRADGTDSRKALLTVDTFQQFHENLGFTVSYTNDFHPFFHEVITVIQSPNVDSPAQLADYDWPCLMLGDMMFCRSGVTVEAGAENIDKNIAESSTIYWTNRRKNRPCNDLSHGWGHNSQWRTALRRDYQKSHQYHFNVDGQRSLNEPNCNVDDITLDAMIELVQNRCMVRTRIDDSDLFPYHYSYTEDK